MVDLLLDPAFFQMDISCLPFWKTILDNLMTYDNTTFRELMGRVSLTQTGGLNIFTSREQEYEQRAVLLKRLAFVIFCSELNQYHKYMPEIQGEERYYTDSNDFDSQMKIPPQNNLPTVCDCRRSCRPFRRPSSCASACSCFGCRPIM